MRTVACILFFFCVCTSITFAQAPKGSSVFSSKASVVLTGEDDPFQNAEPPTLTLIGSQKILHRLEDADQNELANAFVNNISLELFDREHLDGGIQLLRAALEQSPRPGHSAETQLLLVLEILSNSNRTLEALEQAANEFEKISSDELSGEPTIKAEYFFWYAETLRALDHQRKALVYYDSVLSLPIEQELIANSRFRKAELLEEILQFEEARRTYDTLVNSIVPSPLRLLATFRAASLLRSQGKYAAMQNAVRQIKTYLADTTFSSRRTYIEERSNHSPFVSLLRDPSLRNRRIIGERTIDIDSNNTIITPHYPWVYYYLLQASAYSGSNNYDSALYSLQQADSVLAITDSIEIVSDLSQRIYLNHLIEFERGWAELSKNDNLSAAKIFIALSKNDSSSHINNSSTQTSHGLTGTFYNERTNNNATPTASIRRARAIYDDIPARAKFYAGIALFRAGKTGEARDILTVLSQDESAIYSDKARYHLALVEFTSKQMIQAEGLLEPIAHYRTQSGIYAAMLLGDINYRRNNFPKAAEYFAFALANLSTEDTALIAVASLERGLALVPLNVWTEVMRDLRRFVDLSAPGALGLDEGLFWLGRAYLRNDSTEQARLIFQRLLKEFPNNDRQIDAEYGYAWALFRNGNYPQADRSFERVMKLDSISRYAYDALSRRGDAQYAASNIQKAVKIYNQAVDRPTFDNYRTERSMYQLGVLRMKADSARSAINAFNYIINKLPNSDLLDRCYYNIAVASFAIKQPDRANEAINTILKKYKTSVYAPKSAYLLAAEHEREGDYKDAYQAYRKVISGYPNAQEFRLSLFGAINSLVALKRSHDAITLADSFYQKYSSATFASQLLYRKGEIEFASNDFERAKKTFEQFTKKFADDTLYQFSRLMTAKSILAGKGSQETAKEIFLDIAEKNSSSDAAPFAYFELARLAKKNTSGEAPKYYTSAFDFRYYSSDAAPQAMFEYGKYLNDELGKTDSAFVIFDDLTKRYLIETSVGAKAQMQNIAILLDKGKRAEAMTRLQKVAGAHSGDALGAESSLQLADLIYQSGSFKKALDIYDHLRETESLSSDQLGRAYLGSAHSYIKLSEKKKAIILLHRVVSMRGVSSSSKSEAQTLLQTLSPAKKAKKHK